MSVPLQCTIFRVSNYLAGIYTQDWGQGVGENDSDISYDDKENLLKKISFQYLHR